MSILITRPDPEASATTVRLAALGFDCVVAPVLEISPTHQLVPQGSYHAALATSGNALRLMEPRVRRQLINTPIYCVGEKTAETARIQGFHDIRIAEGDGKSLAALVIQEFPYGGHLLYLTGIPRKPFLEDELKQAGLDLLAVDLYRSDPISDWPNSVKRSVQSITHVLHYSRASAEAFLTILAHDPYLTKLRNAHHLCLSSDVAIPLRNDGIMKVEIAAKPNETALFELISRKDL